MAEWILGDPTATNMDECAEYVVQATLTEAGLYDHQSEHTSFQILTPTATVRLSHGRLHQVAMRDPTDQFELPDHLTWQMNVAFERINVNRDASGVLGETFVLTRDSSGQAIMNGMDSIRGSEADLSHTSWFVSVFSLGVFLPLVEHFLPMSLCVIVIALVSACIRGVFALRAREDAADEGIQESSSRACWSTFTVCLYLTLFISFGRCDSVFGAERKHIAQVGPIKGVILRKNVLCAPNFRRPRVENVLLVHVNDYTFPS